MSTLETSDTRPPGLSSHGQWEQRWHPLLREWVVYSAHRQNRPWSGEQVSPLNSAATEFDPDCFLCPGNERVSGAVNPHYTGIFVFDNDRPSLSPDAPTVLQQPPGIYRNKPATGITRVLCYSPLHNTSMAQLNAQQMTAVVTAWQQQTRELASVNGVKSVAIFENKGELCGMSNSHPHGQIYATNFVYKTTERHLRAAHEHYQQTNSTLFADIVQAEQFDGTRIIAENETMVAFVPYFARFAYEVYLAPKRTVAHIFSLNDAETDDLAALLRNILVRMDNLWAMPFPYLMMLQQAPVDDAEYSHFHFHIQLYPPLRTPELRKYVAAHEIGGGNFLSDTMPEDKAADLRACSTLHYLNSA